MTEQPTLTAEILQQAQRWAEFDPDPETRAELTALLADPHTNSAAILSRFAGRLEFGTAGLRAPLGAGPLRMNRVVVMQTTAGLAKFLREQRPADAPQTVVVGFDARKNSAIFARDAAQVLAGYGFRAILLPGPLPTPVTAFAVRRYDAIAGVMITASHNPAPDNGYKLYLGGLDNGSQIVPPQDSAIAAAIAEVAAGEFYDIKISDDFEHGSDFIFTEYVAATLASARSIETHESLPPRSATPQPTIVYTPLHGVGLATTARLFAAADLPELITVAQQAEPDPQFPTAKNPNPENPAALELVFERAAQVGADVILAHDPDADRLAVALPSRDGSGNYTALTGNQLGLLLGWRAAENTAAELAAGTIYDEQPTLANTIVSSPALREVAKHYGLNYVETLSGFKWISRVPGLIFGFEEALGYLVNPHNLRDKDGISAALAVTDLVCELHREGKTLWDMLDEATTLFGAFVSDQITLQFESAAQAAAALQQVRDNPPREFGGVAVANYQDLSQLTGVDQRANVLRFDLADGSRVMMRPSGTEPKLKLYIDCHSTTGTASERQSAAAARAAELTAALRDSVNGIA